MMFKKTASFLWALFVITTLILGQGQIVLAGGTSDTAKPVETGQTLAASTASSLAPTDEAAYVPPQTLKGCALRVVGVGVTEEIPSGYPNQAAGQPYFGLGTLDDSHGDPLMFDPGAGDTVTRAAGDELRWVLLIENSSYLYGSGDCTGPEYSGGPETLTSVQGWVSFAGQEYLIPLNFSGTAGELAPYELAWAEVPYIIPENAPSAFQIVIWAAAEDSTNSNTLPFPPNDTVDRNTDTITIEGPGFAIDSFTATPTEQVPGGLVDFRLTITNTRPGINITGIRVVADDVSNIGSVTFAAACTDYPFAAGTGGTWRKVIGDVELTASTPLLPGEQAYCDINSVQVPSTAPIPPTYFIGGTVTVTDGNTDLDVSLAAQSQSVTVTNAEISVTKQVSQIERNGSVIWPSGGDPMPPVTAGDRITYTIKVKNIGPIAVNTLQVTDSLEGYLSLPQTTLDPDEEITLEVRHIVTIDSQDPLTNHVTARANSSISPFNTVDAEASAIVDVLDSALEVNLSVEDPLTGLPITSVTPPYQVRYRLDLHNAGATQINSLSYVTVGVPLYTVGTPPSIIPTYLVPDGTLSLTWLYNVTTVDNDPLISTVRVRGMTEGSRVIYGQDQASLDLATPGLNISVVVLDPPTETILRGASAVYGITVTNTDSVSPLCEIVVNQFRRDPDTGIEYPVQLDIPMAWPGATARRLEPSGSPATATTTYLVTGADKDPLDMIFEATATSNCSGFLPEPLTDRTTAVLDISDAQINAVLVPDLGADGVAEVGDPIPFTFVAQNVGAVTLENLSATWCILHRPSDFCGLPFDPGYDLNPKSIGSFEDTTGRFTYTIEQPPDADATPFVAEVTMLGMDNKGNQVSIKVATEVPIATEAVLLELTAPKEAVIGDTIPINFTITNLTGVTLNNIRLYNLLVPDAGDPYGYEQVAFFATILGVEGQNVVSGTFDYTIQPGVGISGDVLTLIGRVVGKTETNADVITTATVDVDIIPMIEVIKVGSSVVVAGEEVTYAITIINRSLSQTLTVTDYQDDVLASYGITLDENDFDWPDEIGTLLPGEIATSKSGVLVIPSVEPDVNPLVNVVVVTGTRSSDGAAVFGSDYHEVVIACPVYFGFQVINLDDYPDDILGEWLQWYLQVTNVSQSTITFGGVYESLFYGGSPVTGTVGMSLDPGQTFVVPMPSGGMGPGTKQITADLYGPGDDYMSDTMSAEFSETGGVTECEATFDYPIYGPILITKAPSVNIAFPGETVEYTIRLENLAEADDDPYDEYTATVYDSMFSSPIEFLYDGVNLAPSGVLSPGEVVQTTLEREILASDPEELTNTARVEITDPVTGIRLMGEAEALVYTAIPLKITKTPSVRLATPGTTITYDYTITNITEDYPIYAISFTDLFYLAGETTQEVDLIPGMSGGVLISLEPGESYSLAGVDFYIPLDAPDPLKNTATVKGTILGREITTSITVSIDLEDPDIAITKYARFDDGGGDPVPGSAGIVPETTDPDGLPKVDEGTEVHYCFLIENNGGGSTYVDDIVITDTMFPGVMQTAFQEAIVDLLGHTDTDPNDPLYGIDRLYGGEVVDFCLGRTTLTHDLGDPVYNVVSLEGVTSGGIPTYTQDELAIDIQGTALLVTKIPSPPLAFVGDEITYTIMMQNNAAQPIVNLELTDTRAGGGTLPVPLDAITWPDPDNPGRLLSGEQAIFTYQYTVQNTDPDPLENVAAATGNLDESPNPPDEWPQVSDSTRAVVAITASQLLVNKIASPTIVVASPDNCEMKTGIGDDPARLACKVVHYTISVTNVGSIPVTALTAIDTHFDAETGGVVTELPPGTVFSDTDLDPLETAFLFYDLPVPTSSQLVANPELDPFLNTIEVSGTIFEDGVAGTVSSTADAAVDILQPNVRIIKSPATLAAAPGQTVTYSFVIENLGSEGDTLTGLVFKDLYYVPGATPADPPVEVVASEINLDTDCPNDDPTICPFEYGAEPFGDYDNDPVTPDTGNPKEGYPYNPTDGIYPGGEPGLMAGERLYDRGTLTVQVPTDWAGNEFTNIGEIAALLDADPDPLPVIDRSSATIDIRPEGIEVEKFASVTTAGIGDPVTYTVRVTNIGSAPIERLVIADNAIDGDPDKSLTVENFPDGADPAVLGPNETYEMQYVHTLTASDSDPYVNRVTVTGFSAVGAVVNVAQSAVDIEDAVLVVDKFVCAGNDFTQGDGDPSTLLDPCAQYVITGDATPDIVTYYLHFQNPSGVPIVNIQVIDSVGDVGAITWPYSDVNGSGLGPDDGVDNSGNDELWVMYTYTIQPGDSDPLQNLVTVTGEAPTGTVQVTASVDLSLVAGELLLTKTSVDQAVIGQVITYTLIVENLSDSMPLIAVNVVDPLSPSGIGYIDDCHVDELPPLATHECSFDHTISLADGAPLINTASASGFQLLQAVTDTATHTVQIVSGDLVVSKTADTTVAGIGDDVTFTYQIQNTGQIEITNLVVEDTDPAVTFSSPWPSSLGPGESAVRTWTKTISAADPDPYTNTVLVTGEILGQPISAEATETVYIAAGNLVVTNVPSAAFVLEGDPVTFTYVITNYGTLPITTLEVSDTECGDLSGDLMSRTLAAGASATVYCYIASAALPGPIVSTVYVSGLVSGSTPISDSATSEVAVTSGGLVVTKSADQTVVMPGDTIQYTIEVTNIGDVTLTDFVVDDPMIPGLAPVPPDTLLPQQSFIMSGSYVVGVSDQSVSNVVTVTATDLSGTQQFEDSDSATVAVLEDPNASLALTKEVIPQRALPGQDVTYIFTVRNIGTTTKLDPVLMDDEPFIFDLLPSIAPGGVITRIYEMTVPPETTDPVISNTATVIVGEDLEDTAQADLLVELVSLTKEADLSVVAPNDVVTYTFTLTNNSTSALNSIVTLDDPRIENWSEAHENITLTGSEVKQITGTATVPSDYTDITYDNTAQVLVSGEVVDEASLSLYVPSNALTLTKTADPLSVAPGDDITYTFTIDNLSGEPIDNVTLSDAVVDTYGSYVDPLENETVPAEGITVTATVTVPAAWATLTFDNTATLSVDGTEIDSDSASVDVVVTDLVLTKEADVEMALRGDTVTYTFTITNNGTADANVTVVDLLIDTDPLFDGTVAAGSSETFDATYPIPVGFVGSTLDNTATLSSEGETVSTASDSVLILDNVLSIDKSVAPTEAYPGDTVTYTFTITNTSGATIDDVMVEDLLLDDTNPIFDESVTTAGAVFTVDYDIPLDAEGTVNNTATLSVGGILVGSDSASVTILSQDLNLVKTASPDPVAPGQTLTYTFTIQNNGTETVTGVTIDDPLITSLSGVWSGPVPDPLPLGNSMITATVTVPLPADFNNSDLANTAQLLVDGTPVDEASASVTVLGPTLTKTASPNPVPPSGTITYTFTIENPGTIAIPGVTVEDAMIDSGGTWNGSVPDPLPAGTTQLTATVTAPGTVGTIIHNEAQLLVDDVVVDEDTLDVRVAVPGLLVDITEVYQRVPNAADPANPIHVPNTLPFQTGEPVYIAFTMLNNGTETLSDLTYQARSKTATQTDWQSFLCQRITPATLPSSLAAGEYVDVVCRFTPPIAAAQYFELGGVGLRPTIEVVGAGRTAADVTLTDFDTEDIELVDLRLSVDLQFTLPPGVTPGTNVVAQVVIRNTGASPIGCDSADPAASCHLAIVSDDTGIFQSLWLETPSVVDYLATVVLDAADNDPFTIGDRVTLGPVLFPLLPLKPYTVMVRGGYYSVALEANNLLSDYTVHAEDTEDFRGDISVVVAANPNPPTVGEDVTYTVTVTNIGQFTVSSLTATYQINPVLAALPLEGLRLIGYDSAPAEQTTGSILLSPTVLMPGQSATGTLTKAEDQTGTYLFAVTSVGTALVSGDTTGRGELELTPLGTEDLDPNATEPTIDKVPNVTEVQPGDPIVWTITIRNGSTSTFTGIVMQDTVPDTLTIDSVAVSQGAAVVQGQVVTATVGDLAPGETATITLKTTVDSDVAVPSSIMNSACSTRTNGGQVCETSTVSVAPGVDTLPSTGVDRDSWRALSW